MTKGTIYSISICPVKETKKKEVQELLVTKDGIQNEGYNEEWGRQWGRQISCLNLSSVVAVKEENIGIIPGEFDENILIEGIECELTIGDQLIIDEEIILEITQIGKERNFYATTSTSKYSYLASEVFFCKVIKGGKIKKGSCISVLKGKSAN
jgi:MOSC domain-containing protein YiiM